ncbi:MAG TPA: hypothetical protein VIJ92_02845 [Ginsengibacter sp.]
MIQMAEHAIKTCCIYIFNKDADFQYNNLFSYEEKVRNKTLGQLLIAVRTKTEIQSDFGVILKKFLKDRNFFVHSIFNDVNYGLDTDDNCTKTELFLLELQDYGWNVQNVFLAFLMDWLKESGVYEHLPENIKTNKHLKQAQEKGFSKLFEKNDEISVVFKKHKPN